MPRRNSSFVESLILLPWWVSVIVGAFAYIGIRVGVPVLAGNQPIFRALVAHSESMAKFVGVVFGMTALVSAARMWSVRKQFDSQRSSDQLRELHWKDFENLVGEYFRRHGYTVTEMLGGGPDDGVDLKLQKDGQLMLVQCKRWKGRTVGLPIVRELLGAITAERANGGILVATSTFTSEATDFAAKHGIELMNGEQLLKVIGPLQRSPQPMTASTEVATITQVCPACGQSMVIRTAHKGANAGKSFWGCSNYPVCRGTRPV